MLLRFAVLTALLFSSLSYADFGLGVILGAPTGISAKYTLSNRNAIDGAVAWDLGDDHFHIHGDYLWLKNNGLRIDTLALDWYFGVGGRMVFIDKSPRSDDDDYKLGVRAPIGIGHTFTDPKIEVFAELALILNLLESTDLDIDGGVGARFHF